MFFEEKIELLQKNIKVSLSQIIVPVIIPVIAIFIAVLSFVIFSQRVLFIYDPYTIKISNLDISQIKRAGIKHQLFIKPIEAQYGNFPEIFENLSDRDKRRKIVITAYLYSMLKSNEEYNNFFNNSILYIYGPLFDYEQSENPITVFKSISNEERLRHFLNRFKELVFFMPESIYERVGSVEPESTLISLLTEKFYSQSAGSVNKLPFAGGMGRNSEHFKDGSINILCIRRLSPGARSLITESDGKVIFFDYVNSRNLRQSFYVNTETTSSASLSYDYKKTLHKMFKIMGKSTEKGISYVSVFSFFR
ncbi:MAG: hypothetical protein FWD87_05570 [Spirochaetaceae bacterium]|nr:hypothetical protein [Spirochaetaceae bacterium]